MAAYLAARWRGTPLVEETEDATQDVFLECFREGGILDRTDSRRPGGFRAFLFGVTRNIARRTETRRARRREVPADDLASDLEATESRASAAFDREWARSIMREAATRQEPSLVQRFVEEAQIEGQLTHPGIVPIYGLGLEPGGRPYFAMKLVKGETLTALLAKRKSPAEDRRRFLGIFEPIAQTVAYAHARHVVHRDLKPANVLVGSFGEVQVVDWGFAKVLARGGVADEGRAVREAMARAERLAGEAAQAPVGDLAPHEAAVAGAQQAADLARSGDVDETTRGAAAALVATTEAQRAGARERSEQHARDVALAARLEEIRLGRGDTRFLAEVEDGYAAAFAEHGLDLQKLTVDEAAVRIAASAIRTELRDALDDWAAVRRRAGASASRLVEIASRADPDPWRGRLRRAAAAGDRATLVDLAPGRDGSVASTILLACGLADCGEPERAVAVLRDAIRDHSDSFWLDHLLGLRLENRDPAEAVRFQTAALALRPGCVEVLHHLGLALRRAGRPAEAIDAWQQALERQPDYVHLFVHLAET